METSENKYKEVIMKLRETSPVVKNPEKLTLKIIAEVENHNAIPKHHLRRSTILILRPVIAVAACLLIALFIYQNSGHYTPTIAEIEKSADIIKQTDYSPTQTEDLQKIFENCLEESAKISEEQECKQKIVRKYISEKQTVDSRTKIRLLLMKQETQRFFNP